MKKCLGFTLIEVTIVTTIIGILAAISIPVYNNTIEQRKGEMCINNIRMITAALMIYNMREENGYDPSGGTGHMAEISKINNDLGTVLYEGNFGGCDSEAGKYGFYFIFYYGANPPFYLISTYRQGGKYDDSTITCNYYPSGNENGYHYVWGGNWPWLPSNE